MTNFENAKHNLRTTQNKINIFIFAADKCRETTHSKET